MKIRAFIRLSGGIKALGEAKFKDGGVAYGAMKTIKAYNKSLEVYNEMAEGFSKSVGAETDEKKKKDLEVILTKQLNEAAEHEIEFTPPRVFKMSELVLPDNPYNITPFHLSDLEELGALSPD